MTNDAPKHPLPATTEPGPGEIGQIELAVGIKWMSRLGIVALLAACAMALKVSFEMLNLDPMTIKWLKVLGAGLLAGVFYGLGRWLYQRFNIFGRVLQAGGLTLGYLALFGSFFVAEVQLFDPAQYFVLGWSLLCGYVALMMFAAIRLDSKTVALLSLTFGYYTASYAQEQWVAFAAAGILSVAAVVLSHTRANWRIVSVASMAGTLVTFLYWNLFRHGITSATGFGVYEEQKLYLWFNYGVYQVSNLLPAMPSDDDDAAETPFNHNLRSVLNLVNTFVFYGLYHATGKEGWPAGVLELVVAIVHGFAYALAYHTGAHRLKSLFNQTHLLLAISFSGLAGLKYFDADMEAPVLAVQALCLGLMGVRCRQCQMPSALYELFAILFWIVSVFSLSGFSWSQLAAQSPWALVATVGLVCLIGGVLEHTVIGGRLQFKLERLISATIVLTITSIHWMTAILTAFETSWETLTMGITSLVLLGLGFGFASRKFRWLGLAWLVMALIRLIFWDVATLTEFHKMMVFGGLGAVMLIGSLIYNVIATQTPKSAAIGQTAEPDKTTGGEA